MSFINDSSTIALTPDEFGDVYWQPLRNSSVALQVTQNVRTSAHTYRVPVVLTTPTADWGAEGSTIVDTDPTVTEAECTPARLAGLTYISRELADDSGSAVGLVTDGLIADLAKKLDEAFFGSPASTLAPAGLLDLTGVQTVTATGGFTNLDAFAEAQSKAETVGARVNAFVASPATVLDLMQLKEATGSNRPILGSDVSSPTGRSVFGVPLYSSRYVNDTTVWAIPSSAAMSILRTPAEMAISTDAAFSSYSLAVRVVQRAGFLFPHARAIVKIATA